MTAEVILFPNQNSTEPPGDPAQREGAYVLELEQENLDLRDALASAVLRSRRGYRTTAIGFAVLVAFGVGWLLDPPIRVAGASPGLAAPSEGRPASESYAITPRSWRAHRAPRLLDLAVFHDHTL